MADIKDDKGQTAKETCQELNDLYIGARKTGFTPDKKTRFGRALRGNEQPHLVASPALRQYGDHLEVAQNADGDYFQARAASKKPNYSNQLRANHAGAATILHNAQANENLSAAYYTSCLAKKAGIDLKGEQWQKTLRTLGVSPYDDVSAMRENSGFFGERYTEVIEAHDAAFNKYLDARTNTAQTLEAISNRENPTQREINSLVEAAVGETAALYEMSETVQRLTELRGVMVKKSK